MEDKSKKADSAAEARKNETPAGERTLTQDTGPKNQEETLKGDDTVDDATPHLEGDEVGDADKEYKGGLEE